MTEAPELIEFGDEVVEEVLPGDPAQIIAIAEDDRQEAPQVVVEEPGGLLPHPERPGAKGFRDHVGHAPCLVADDREVAQGPFAAADLLLLDEEECQLGQRVDRSQQFMTSLREVGPSVPFRRLGRLDGCRTTRSPRCSLDPDPARDRVGAHFTPSLKEWALT